MAQTSFYKKARLQLINATGYSLDGFKYLYKSEFAARIEIYLFFWANLLLLFLGASLRVFLITTLLFLVLIAVEALNTAIEVIIDKISPHISETGKRAKDLGSFAVMCLLAVNSLYFINAVIATPRVSELLSMVNL